MERQLDESIYAEPDEGGALSNLCECGDISAVALGQGVPFSRVTVESVRARLDAGAFCFGILHHDAIATALWVAPRPAYVRGIGLTFAQYPGDCYVFNAATDPVHRRQGLFRAMQQALLAHLREQGFERVIQVVDHDASVPARVLSSLGYSPTTLVTSTTVLGVRRISSQSCAFGTRTGHWRLHAYDSPTDLIV